MLPFTKTLSPRLSDSPIRLCRNNSQEQCCLPQKTRSKPILTKTRNICFLCQWSKNQHKLTALSLCLGLVFHFLQTFECGARGKWRRAQKGGSQEQQRVFIRPPRKPCCTHMQRRHSASSRAGKPWPQAEEFLYPSLWGNNSGSTTSLPH